MSEQNCARRGRISMTERRMQRSLCSRTDMTAWQTSWKRGTMKSPVCESISPTMSSEPWMEAAWPLLRPSCTCS